MNAIWYISMRHNVVAQTVTEMEMQIMNDQIAHDLEVALAEVMGDD